MGTKLNKVPANEAELNKLLQDIYLTAKDNYDNDKDSNFTGILEIIASEPNIISSIHKIKSNKGSHTSGVDDKDIDDYLGKGYDEVIEIVRNKLYNYNPDMVRRVWIPKPGKSEKRPLGIPTIIDRIIQECVRNILEPIAEGQFFEHSYGFRPMRSADMAVARIKRINFTSKCCWIVEGDIKGFFDNIDHNVMIKSLWNLGIKDKRVLSIIKQMLKAGVMEECSRSELGTPQGGIISPLLANIYLNKFDNYMTGDFERKKLRKPHTRRDGELTAMRNHSNLKTCYYVRYADDWVILTDNQEDAERLKHKAKRYLKETLKLELSEEKTLITNVRIKPIKFLGVEIRMVKKNGVWVNKVSPDRKRFQQKMKSLSRQIFYIRKTSTQDMDRLIQNITRVNSIIVGLINYYSMCDQISVVVRKYAWLLKYTAYKSLKRYGGKWVRANEVSNLIGLHYGHRAHIPAIKYKDMYIGITDINFAKWENPVQKKQAETPYTPEGRELYNKRMRKKGLKVRTDEVNSTNHALFIRMSKSPLYNFEYFMNRPYTYNRDKGKCKLCGGYVEPNEARFHHVDKKLPTNLMNKVKNLITVHQYCHDLIHNNSMPESLSEKTMKNLTKYRKKLN
ncbi:MAG: group II intron reverse transcriptase/maturase [Cellulosilyticum sp.]|nr:group II intron reverse transcriptase/maturase [Cellulosilyticum sp.]